MPGSYKPKPVVVVGSVNADIYLEVERLPEPGETLSASSGQTLPGGKGANQAACAAKLDYPTVFVGQVGKDANARLVLDALREYGVETSHVSEITSPTGHAVVILQKGGQNSIIIVGGANTSWTKSDNNQLLSEKAKEIISNSGILLLQREIPEVVNIEAALVIPFI